MTIEEQLKKKLLLSYVVGIIALLIGFIIQLIGYSELEWVIAVCSLIFIGSIVHEVFLIRCPKCSSSIFISCLIKSHMSFRRQKKLLKKCHKCDYDFTESIQNQENNKEQA